MSGAGAVIASRAAHHDPHLKPAFPWHNVIAYGLAHLRLSPRDFWALTMRELSMMAAPPQTVLDTAHFHALMQRYPDARQE